MRILVARQWVSDPLMARLNWSTLCDFAYTFTGEILRTGIVVVFLSVLMTYVVLLNFELNVVFAATLLGFIVILAGLSCRVTTRYRYHFKFSEDIEDEVTRFIAQNRLRCGGVYHDYGPSGNFDFVNRIKTVPIVCREDYCLLKMRF